MTAFLFCTNIRKTIKKDVIFMKESNQTNNEQNNPLASAPLKSLLLKYSIADVLVFIVSIVLIKSEFNSWKKNSLL